MTSSPDSAASFHALEAGLAAIKQGNYPEAIQQLERFLAAQAGALTQPNATKAQMGLVMAYARSGRSRKAANLCRELNRSSNPKVREWASRTLGEIWEQGRQGNQEARQTEAAEPDATGFVPLQEAAQDERARPPARSTIKQPIFVSPTTDRGVSDQSVTGEESAASQHLSQSNPVSISSVAVPTNRRNMGRAQRWQALDRLNPARLQWAEMGTAIALFGLVGALFAAIAAVSIFWLQFATSVLKWGAYIPPFQIPYLSILLGLGVLWVVSPWLLDRLLTNLYGMQPLSSAVLARHSPEAHRMIQRICQQYQMPVPRLRVVSTQVPLSFAYGSHPKIARILVSQSLLEQLRDDEIAAIYATELSHIVNWDFSVMTWVMTLLQIPYTFYWQAAQAGDWLSVRSKVRKQESALIALMLGIGSDLLAIVASLSYGLYRFLRWSGLWLSRQRVEYGDRTACSLTGHPNALMRALLKIAIGTANTLQQQTRTDYLLEGFDLLTPLGCLTALHLGSLYPHAPLNTLLVWEQENPDRQWLALNNSHPLMGDRLQHLIRYARQWNLEPEVDLETALTTPVPCQTMLLLQGAPFLGIAVGYIVAQVLWFAAQILYWLGVPQISWAASDYDLFAGFMLLGFGLGTYLRFNRFFPELQRNGQLQPANAEDRISIADLSAVPNASPINSQPICLEGILLGRSGIGNWLGQDLILQTRTGCIKLHYMSRFGAIGNLLPPRPVDLVGQSVLVTGWFRRGATVWLDADTIRTSDGRTIRSGHQVWSTALAGLAILMAIAFIL